MPVNQALLALLQARSVVERVSLRYGISARDLRTLSAIQCLTGMDRSATITGIAELLGLSVVFDTHRAITRLRRSGMVERTNATGKTMLLALTAPGLRLVGLLEREERDARRRVQSITATRKKRAYVKSGKFVGKAAKQKERGK